MESRSFCSRGAALGGPFHSRHGFGGGKRGGDSETRAKRRRYAGQNEAYLIAQLQAFTAGDRKNEMMSVVIQDLSDADMENLAAY
jgi:cytochrome c553